MAKLRADGDLIARAYGLAEAIRYAEPAEAAILAREAMTLEDAATRAQATDTVGLAEVSEVDHRTAVAVALLDHVTPAMKATLWSHARAAPVPVAFEGVRQFVALARHAPDPDARAARQHDVDTGQLPGTTSADNAELVAARHTDRVRTPTRQDRSSSLNSSNPTPPNGVRITFELVRRINASDVGNETLERLEAIVDELAIAYPKTPPTMLLARIRQHLGYVNRLLDARKTLAEHHRLLVVGGWLSLLGATVHIDLNQADAATARLKTAATLARHTGHSEIHAWCYETEAWRVLTEGNYAKALELSDTAKALAPIGSSVAIQATAQQGRAYARLGNQPDTYDAITEVQRLVSPLPKPDRPEHHYRYDPDKSVAYTATTLAWLGDPAAEEYAREIIRRLSPEADVSKWPRRVASANIDLSLALLVGIAWMKPPTTPCRP